MKPSFTLRWAIQQVAYALAAAVVVLAWVIWEILRGN